MVAPIRSTVVLGAHWRGDGDGALAPTASVSGSIIVSHHAPSVQAEANNQGEATTKEKQREVTGLITALIIGLIIGALGRLVAPGKQNIPIWLTLLVGVAAALLGNALAAGPGVANTPGIDWSELFIKVALAAVGVTTVAGIYSRRGART